MKTSVCVTTYRQFLNMINIFKFGELDKHLQEMIYEMKLKYLLTYQYVGIQIMDRYG